jgi:dihydropteroate synthase
MDSMTDYNDVVADVGDWLSQQILKCAAAGVPRWRIYADPGFGFAKTAPQSAAILAELPRLRQHLPLGMPLVVGFSRKRMVDHLLKLGLPMPPTAPTSMADRDLGGLALATWAAINRAEVLRLHDVRPASFACAAMRGLQQFIPRT